MRARATVLIAGILLCSRPLAATGLVVSPATLSRGTGAPSVTCEVSWRNGWRNDRNHDAAWLFVRLSVGKEGRSRRARLATSGHTVSGALELRRPEDGAGAFLLSSVPHRGDVRATVRLELDPAALDGVQSGEPVTPAVFGIEMVSIPAGPFFLGDPDPAALDYGGFFRAGPGGAPDGLYPVVSEAAIEVGPEPGRLDYRVKQPEYQGDRRGPVPAAFPKGTAAFYVMKYEVAQGEYAAFLNTLGDEASYFRAIHAGRDYARTRGSIALVDGRYVAASPARPANRVSWDDGCAFADWAGLRPMTDLEWVKACRGPERPVARAFPWGTASKARLLRVVRPDDELVTSGDADESRLSDDTREVLGASYYWVMDLAGSVWEKVVTLGHPTGRAFRGTHGDGRLTSYGFATNDDWPKGDEGRGGFGYLGGGHYEHGKPEGEFNPHSPVSFRRFGSWGDAPRSLAYGFRAARTAP